MFRNDCLERAYLKLASEGRGTTVTACNDVTTNKPMTFVVRAEEHSRKSDAINTNETLVYCLDGCNRRAVVLHGLETLIRGSVYRIRTYPCLCPGETTLYLPNRLGLLGLNLKQPDHMGIMPFYGQAGQPPTTDTRE